MIDFDYLRVFPRDLFNESKLLKCLGQLALNCRAESGVHLHIEGNDWTVGSDTDDGSIYLKGALLDVFGTVYMPWTSLNSKDRYPLYITDSDDDEILVLDEDGAFTDEFIDHVNYLKL